MARCLGGRFCHGCSLVDITRIRNGFGLCFRVSLVGCGSFGFYSWDSSDFLVHSHANLEWVDGGYLAGRLRTKWAGIHTDEVYFRDTAHGFLAWAVAVVVTAAFLTSAATSLMGSVPDKGTAPQSQMSEAGPNAYFIDSLFRTDGSRPEVNNTSVTREAAVIFATSLKQGDLSSTDRTYLDQLVMSRTGVSQSEADKRVNEAFLSAKSSAEATRKAIAHSLLWTFIALLIGAFFASFAGTIGGRQRDHVVLVNFGVRDENEPSSKLHP